jgi:NADH-quinone oxidoreductase subunit G
MDDVAEDPVLNVSERGDRAYIGKFEEKDLTHEWAGNVVELCPVGALLSKDFLNKARAWELDRTASVCPNCTQGCNTILETRDNIVVRMRPRANPEVNEYFLCDTGRLDYRWMNGANRAELPQVRRGASLVDADWDVALGAAAAAIRGKRSLVLASPMLSNEALHLLSRLVRATNGSGAFRVARGHEAPLPGVKDLALRAERAANVVGAEKMGFTKTDTPLAGLRDGDVLVIADHALTDAELAAAGKASAVIVIGTTLPAGLANVAAVLPITNFAEEEGTFTNLRGRVQRFLQAKAAPGLARPSWFVLTDLLASLGEKTDYFLPADVFAALAASHPEFTGLSYDSLGLRGLPVIGSVQAAGAPS